MSDQNAKKPMRVSKLPFALLVRYLASGFVRFGPPRKFRPPKPGDLRR